MWVTDLSDSRENGNEDVLLPERRLGIDSPFPASLTQHTQVLASPSALMENKKSPHFLEAIPSLEKTPLAWNTKIP